MICKVLRAPKELWLTTQKEARRLNMNVSQFIRYCVTSYFMAKNQKNGGEKK